MGELKRIENMTPEELALFQKHNELATQVAAVFHGQGAHDMISALVQYVGQQFSAWPMDVRLRLHAALMEGFATLPSMWWDLERSKVQQYLDAHRQIEDENEQPQAKPTCH